MTKVKIIEKKKRREKKEKKKNLWSKTITVINRDDRFFRMCFCLILTTHSFLSVYISFHRIICNIA